MNQKRATRWSLLTTSETVDTAAAPDRAAPPISLRRRPPNGRLFLIETLPERVEGLIIFATRINQ
jgi:hypothetical protein